MLEVRAEIADHRTIRSKPPVPYLVEGCSLSSVGTLAREQPDAMTSRAIRAYLSVQTRCKSSHSCPARNNHCLPCVGRRVSEPTFFASQPAATRMAIIATSETNQRRGTAYCGYPEPNFLSSNSEDTGTCACVIRHPSSTPLFSNRAAFSVFLDRDLQSSLARLSGNRDTCPGEFSARHPPSYILLDVIC